MLCSARICFRFLGPCPSAAFSSRASSSSASVAPSSTQSERLQHSRPEVFKADGEEFKTDEKWNLSPTICRLMERRLLQEEKNPLSLLKQRIVNHMHKTHRKPGGRSPLFAVCENERRVVTTYDNFDVLLTPSDHVSRRTSDTYYVNETHCLRAHTSAHQHKIMAQGFDCFLAVGDVYRRDDVDSTHYPCFHQMEGVRLYSADELFNMGGGEQCKMLEEGERTSKKQAEHTEDAAKVLEIRLKSVLEDLSDVLFGAECEKRWVDAYFPFTHPSFELEVKYEGKWLEVLGCGIMEQKLLKSAGVHDKAGWAFGVGLERLAMVLYQIPDIRLFWSRDSGFLSQFEGAKPEDNVKYRPISAHPQVLFDISFFLPNEVGFVDMKSDVCDVIRNVGAELIEQVKLTDEFENKKKGTRSQTYRIVYRSNERALTKDEVNTVHKAIERELTERFGVKVR